MAWPRANNVHTIRVSIANTCFPLLDKIKEVTGTGAIVGKVRRNKRHQEAANWACTGDRARDFLKVVYPWLIAKKANAAVALEAIEEWKRTGKSSPELAKQIHHPRLVQKLLDAKPDLDLIGTS